MKKILLFISLLIFPFFVNASSDVVNDFKMDIYIDSNGDAHITETWDATANMGSEFYHTYNNYGNSTFSDFSVTMDDTPYTFIDNWDINGSLDDKEYKNGFNYTSDGVELCFGKTKLGRHTYVAKYKISNFVLGLTDSQMVYWTLIPYNNGGQFKNITIKIHSDFEYQDTLDVWGYGNYGGTAYVYDGYIEMTSEGVLDNDEYMTILVKFPPNSFNTLNKDEINDFNYYFNMAEEGSTHYVDDSDNDDGFNVFFIIFNFIFWIIAILGIVKGADSLSNSLGNYRLDYGKRGKKISKDIPNYRDIPCNKDIHRSYFISTAFSLMKKKTDFLGAILLKWLKEEKISTTKVTSKILKKENTAIDLKTSTFDNKLEQELYDMLYESSKDGILEDNEFEKWCKKNYDKILKWFDKVINEEGEVLENKGYLTLTKNSIFGTKKCTVNDRMFEDAEKLAGLKKFLIEFSRIKEKQPIEVKLWCEYLIYAQIFGIAEEVAKQFKKLYPDMIEGYNYDYDTFIFINHISTTGIASASTARSRAQSYSSGGGGFSSGGGGGGSSGGGGGGGMGGR